MNNLLYAVYCCWWQQFFGQFHTVYPYRRMPVCETYLLLTGYGGETEESGYNRGDQDMKKGHSIKKSSM